MGLFEVPTRAGKAKDNSIAKKSKSQYRPATVAIKGGGSVLDRIQTIKAMVEKHLGKYKDKYILIQDKQTLIDYIDACIENRVIAIDTETTGLDPLQDEIAGICIYTPGQKGAYIPINHISYITMEKVKNQLPIEFVKEQFQRIADSDIDDIMFNAAFDIRFMKNQVGVKLNCTWDCYLAARLLNENEGAGNNGLKKLHQKYCLNGVGDAFSFGDLFNGIPFTQIPINTGYLYAARDPEITYELYEYQKQYLYYDPACDMTDRNGLNGVAWVFENIEMPCVDAVVEMEDNGIEFDFDYASELSEKYHKKLDETKQKFYELCSMYSKEIELYKSKNQNHKLKEPINIGSTTQLAILLYDIIGLEQPVDKKIKKATRGTGVEILESFDNPICKAVLEYRTVDKLIGTYIDKLPDCVNPNTGRIHCKFNQYGADTGRFSSSDPNMQNIPSHNKDIRKMFVASEGNVLMSSDFSQQEPKCLAALCRKQGDSQMYDTFMQGKDLYSEIASKAFNVPYEDCLEFRPDGTTNKQGKERRTQAKSILLGVLYGRGEASIAEQLGCSTNKAKEIKESVFRGFPAIKKFEQSSLEMAKTVGYVTTVCGRKRRLPDLMLDEYEFKWRDGVAPDDDPLGFDEPTGPTEVPDDRINYYLKKLSRSWGGQKRKIFEEANEEGIRIVDNGGKIADASRQCVNSRIQGSAADLTKLAMIELLNNQKLKELGFKILIPVHDEIIAECPEVNMKDCSRLLAETMSKAAEKILEMPIKCDVEITRQWYGEVIE